MTPRLGFAVACVLATGVAACGTPSHRRAVSIRIAPGVSLQSGAIRVVVSGLPPSATVRLDVRAVDAAHMSWSSTAEFRANAAGVVDLGRTPADAGAYRGVWSMGLIASLAPHGDPPGGFFAWNVQTPVPFTLTVTGPRGTRGSRTFLRRLSARPLVERSLTRARDGIVGVYVAPDEPQGPHRPAVLALGGSGGGIGAFFLAEALAARGYPTLALGYFGAPGLPSTLANIPLEYFRAALAWLAVRPGVDRSRMLALGISRGSEAALLLGVHYPRLVHGVIAAVPGNAAHCGRLPAGPRRCPPSWTLAGTPVPTTRDFFNPAPTDNPDAVIPVERIAGPVLLICAQDDRTWDSCANAAAIERRLGRRRAASPPTLLALAGASHAAGTLVPDEPYVNNVSTTAQVDGEGRERAFAQILAFLATATR